MNRFRTLQFRLSALVFAFGIFLIAISFTRQYFREVSAHRSKMRISAYSEGARLSGLAQHFLRRQLPQSADLVMSYTSADPDLLHAIICDGADVVRHATELQWRGLPLKQTPLKMAAPVLQQVRGKMEARMEEVQDGHRLLAVFPFWDVAANMSKGAVVLEYDLRKPLLAAQNRVIFDSLAEAFALTGGCLLLWSLLHVMVTERVTRIVEQTHRIGWESATPEPIQGPDELANVSRSITAAVHRLRSTEQRFRHIASSMRDVFWVAPAPREEEVYVNPAYEEHFGRPATRLKAKRWDWLHTVMKEDRGKVLDMLRRLRREPGEVDLEIRLERPDGLRWMNSRSFSVLRPGQSEGPLQVVGVLMDITERKELERQLIEVAEQERRRIGQDLHDDVCQRLAAAHLKTGVLQANLNRSALPQANLAAEVQRELSEATDIARRYAKGLAPVAVGPGALPQALEDLATFLHRAFGVRCSASCEPIEGLVTAEAAAQIYRVAQELATNAAKHAHGTWIAISLLPGEEGLHLEVSNDGATYDPARGAKPRGMGIRIVQQRVDALGATLEFQPGQWGAGTTAICEVPYSNSTPTHYDAH